MGRVNNESKTIFVSPKEMENKFVEILLKSGMEKEKAEKCSEIFAQNSVDGIYSHGVNRFVRFTDYIAKKYINVNSEPELVHKSGGIEQWNGNLGAGPLNALFSAKRAMELADKNSIGCVALSNTNHWMRGGYYGWKAAKEGYAFISWTNTIAIMPAWGAKDSRLGNNPIVFAVPFKNEAIVLDMAVSQFSYGTMENHARSGKKLPVYGGYNTNGMLTDNASEILETRRPLPVGYWKGAGLSLLLDILASVLSGGLATSDIDKQPREFGVSQVFIAIALQKLGNSSSIPVMINKIVEDMLLSEPADKGSEIFYPGMKVLRTRNENLKKGIPVEKSVWDEILKL